MHPPPQHALLLAQLLLQQPQPRQGLVALTVSLSGAARELLTCVHHGYLRLPTSMFH